MVLIRDKRGFTLLEILVVIAILGILAAAIAPLIFAQMGEQRTEGTLNDMDALSQAIQKFYKDTGKMPPVLETLVTLSIPYDDDFDGTVDEDGACTVSPCPVDPTGVNPDNYRGWKGPYLQGGGRTLGNPVFSDAWGGNYNYCFVETGFNVNGNTDAGGNPITDLICVGPAVNPDGSRQMDAWAVNNGFLMCPRQEVQAVVLSFGKDRGPNLLPVVFFDNDATYEEFDPANPPANPAYDANGFLRIVINDDDDVDANGVVDGDCITAETTGQGGVDEDDFDGVDNDGDGLVDEDAPYGSSGHAGDLFRTVSISDLTQDLTSLTAERLNTLEQAIKQFYRDTNRIPPNLLSLISLNVPYDDNFDGTIGAGEVIATGYAGWNGPYLNGPPDLTNTNFLDGWGSLITMMTWVDGSATLPPHPFTFDVSSRNDTGYALGKYQAVLLSRGKDLQFNAVGSGRPDNISFDNDGDTASDEDPVDGIDNDGDGRIDEDPDETASNPAAGGLVLSDDDGDGRDDEDPEDGLDNDGDTLIDEDPSNTDQDAPDAFRLVSIRDVISEKEAHTRTMLASLNQAAQKFNIDSPLFDNDGDAAFNEDPVDTIDNDADTLTDEDPAGYADLDVEEGKVAGGAFNTLRSMGYIGGSYQVDSWGQLFLWDSVNDRFYSAGLDQTPLTADDLF